MEWVAPASGGGLTVITTGTLSGATPSITSIPATFTHLLLHITDIRGSGANVLNLRFNSDTGSNYANQIITTSISPNVSSGGSTSTSFKTGNGVPTGANPNGYVIIELPFYSGTVAQKNIRLYWGREPGSNSEWVWGSYAGTAAISSIQLFLDGGSTFSDGAFTLYGVN